MVRWNRGKLDKQGKLASSIKMGVMWDKGELVMSGKEVVTWDRRMERNKGGEWE